LSLSPIEERWVFDHIELEEGGTILAEAIRQGEAIAVCDGSFQNQFGTAAWVLEGACPKGRIIGRVVVPGTAKDQSAYRSELAGIFSILLTVNKLCEFFNVDSGSLELGCDGQSALDKAFNQVSILQVGDSNYDMLFAIRSLWALSPIKWKFRHIMGHQDDHVALDKLDRWAKLNIEMDKRAKQHIHIAQRSPRHYMIYAEPWSVWSHGKKIVTDFSDTIYDIVHSNEAKSYWAKKDDIPEEVVDSIDWDMIKAAMSESKRPRRIFISKHASGMCGVGRFMKRWKWRQDDSCPRCGHPEDSAHVWLCHGEGADDVWETALNNLEAWFNIRQTDPDIQNIILSYLKNWREEVSLGTANIFLFDDLILRQSRIGWRRFFEGWLARDWSVAQQAYYQLIKSRRSGKRWAVELIKKLWAIAWDLWEHRNGILHDTQNEVTKTEMRALHRNVTDAYTNLMEKVLPAHDRHLISLKLSRLLKKDGVYKKA
jgi:hypothetical protein